MLGASDLRRAATAFVNPLVVIIIITTVGGLYAIAAYAEQPTWLRTLAFAITGVLGFITCAVQWLSVYHEAKSKEELGLLFNTGYYLRENVWKIASKQVFEDTKVWRDQVVACLSRYKGRVYAEQFNYRTLPLAYVNENDINRQGILDALDEGLGTLETICKS